jgi:hypothetical protein
MKFHRAALLPAVVGLLAALAFGLTGTAQAAQLQTASQLTAMTGVPANAAHQVAFCIPANRSMINAYTNLTTFPGCAANEQAVSLVPGSGPQGPAGPQGPSGVQALTTITATEHDGIVAGGSFFALSTEVANGTLDAGTYQVCVNGKVEQPTASAGQLSAQLFLYDQAKNAGFAGDLLNVSTPTQGGTTHDAYLNGCTLVSETGAVTLHLYGFGYLSDNGSATYNLMAGATISAIKLTPAA